jgi:hypothetical protein
VPGPAIYIGLQGDYAEKNTLPPSVEQLLLTSAIDGDGCTNGEAQVFHRKF